MQSDTSRLSGRAEKLGQVMRGWGQGLAGWGRSRGPKAEGLPTATGEGRSWAERLKAGGSTGQSQTGQQGQAGRLLLFLGRETDILRWGLCSLPPVSL